MEETREFSDEEYPHKEITEKIIGAAIEVHRVLGPGYVEKIYETALAHEFRLRGIGFENQFHVQVPYKEVIAGKHRLDFVVEDSVAVELKAVTRILDTHEAQTLSSMKATNLHVGLLLNFNVKKLVDGLKRFIL